MSDTPSTVAAPADAAPLIRMGNLVWVALAIAAMIAVIQSDDLWALNFVHVIAGVLWTGIYLFMGLVLGPVLRRLDIGARRALVSRLMPRTLFLMPTLAIVTSTAGWYLAVARGYTELPYPAQYWVVAALIIVAVLTVQGLGFLLPTNLRMLLELRKPAPDMARIGRWMRLYIWVIASQAVLQVTIIVIMARFATGI